jgi:hypothetical protein
LGLGENMLNEKEIERLLGSIEKLASGVERIVDEDSTENIVAAIREGFRDAAEKIVDRLDDSLSDIECVLNKKLEEISEACHMISSS